METSFYVIYIGKKECVKQFNNVEDAIVFVEDLNAQYDEPIVEIIEK